MKKALIIIGIILFVVGGGIQWSYLNAQTSSPKLTISPSGTLNPGQSFMVMWNSPESTHSSTDWIGLYKVGDRNTMNYTWVYASHQTGSALMYAPQEPGTYELRYLPKNGYESTAKSSSFTVGLSNGNNNGGNPDNGNATTTPQPNPNNGGNNATTYSLSVSSTSIQPGDTIKVTWQAPQNASINQDWIGIYKGDAPDDSYNYWKYVKSAQGTMEMYVPVQAGTYEVRYFKNNTYEQVTKTSFIVLGAGGGNNNGGNNGGGNATTTPNPNPNPNPGNENYTVTISPTGMVRPGSLITVTWNVPQGANTNTSRDWVGVYQVGSDNTEYGDWAYIGQNATSTMFRAPTDEGDYEIRYLKNNGYTSVAKSPVFRVQLGEVSNGNIIAFGDSLTAGFGATENNDYVSVLSRRIGQPIENRGVIGDTTAEALARLDRDVLRKNPDVVIVLLGGNDVIQRVPREQTFSNLRKIIQKIKARGSEVVLVGIHQTIYNSQYQAIANETDSYYVPEVLSGILGRNDLTTDLIHPNNAGYVIVAQRIEPVLRAALAQ